uniref:Uncharacterized protein n=1 Tax=Leersia perrieri TaxID=77586 RepID=A0A0D9VV01_9ORYZ
MPTTTHQIRRGGAGARGRVVSMWQAGKLGVRGAVELDGVNGAPRMARWRSAATDGERRGAAASTGCCGGRRGSGRCRRRDATADVAVDEVCRRPWRSLLSRGRAGRSPPTGTWASTARPRCRQWGVAVGRSSAPTRGRGAAVGGLTRRCGGVAGRHWGRRPLPIGSRN